MTTRQSLYNDFVMNYRVTVTKLPDPDCWETQNLPFEDLVESKIDDAVSSLVEPGRGIVSVELLKSK